MNPFKSLLEDLKELWEGWKGVTAKRVTIPGCLLLDVFTIQGEEIVCEDTYYLEMVDDKVNFTSESIEVEVNRKKTKCRLPNGEVRRFFDTGQMYAIADYIWLKELEAKLDKTHGDMVLLAFLKATR